MSTFYKIDSTRFSFREYWWGTPNPLVIFAWMTKVLRAQVPGSMDDPATDSLQPHEVASLPEQVQTRFQPLIDELTACGFHSPIYHVISDGLQNTKIYWASFCHTSGQAFARIHHRIWTTPHPARVYLFPMFVSAFADGTFLVSSSGKPDSEAPATVRTVRKIGMSATHLWAAHQQELSREVTARSAYSVDTPEHLRSVVELHHAALRDFHLARRAWRPMTPAEVKQVETMQEISRTCEAEGLQHAEVLAELYKLQQKKTGWVAGVVLLAISMVVFIGAGSAQWSWKIAVALVPILLFHELGHYIAMRAFNYRNLRMFFIPGFGAAVSGQNYNVPGWKKVIVSLMGPVPGIVLGSILGCAGLILHKTLLVKAAFLTLILNGFNLLPVLPLDGGWVMHAALFSRHYVLDTAFRGLAGAALVIGGFLAKDRWLTFIGVFMLFSIPVSYKIARIGGDLRQRGLSAASPDDQNIPTQTAQTIIGELKSAFPKGMTHKTLALHTLNLFESLNARPPGWFATLGLLSVHGFTFLMALVFGIMFAVAEHGNLGNVLNMAATLPRHKVSCDSVSASGRLADAHGSPNTIIATFKNGAQARQVFQNLSSQLQTNAALKIFGESLLLAIPAEDDSARKRWLARIQGETTNVFVDRTNFEATCRVACIAPNEQLAKQIQDEAADYFLAGREMYLVPPWSRADSRSMAEREQHRLARRTYAKLQDGPSLYKEPALIAVSRNLTRAQRQGDPDEVKKLQEEQRRLTEEFTTQHLAKIRQEPGLDAKFIEFYTSLPKLSYTNAQYRIEYKERMRAVGKHLGQLALRGSDESPTEERFSTKWGSVHREGLMISFPHLTFQRVFDGAPALVEWLCSKGCLDVKYAFESGFGFAGLGDE